MTFLEFENKVGAFDVELFVKKSIFDNREQITETVRDAWNEVETPSGFFYCGKVQWFGGDVSANYSKMFKIKKRNYNYTWLNISGDTRRNLEVNQNSVIYSKTSYWDKIVSNFKKQNIDITDFSGRDKKVAPKKDIQIILINYFKKHLK